MPERSFVMTAYLPWIWLAAIVLFAIIEASTVQLVSIWFVAGAGAALLVSLFTRSVLAQLVVFVIVTALTLVFTRPLVAKRLEVQRVATNADRAIGRTAVVRIPLDPLSGGRVEVDGQNWSARCTQALPAGAFCRVDAIEGATLIVSPIKEEVTCPH